MEKLKRQVIVLSSQTTAVDAPSRREETHSPSMSSATGASSPSSSSSSSAAEAGTISFEPKMASYLDAAGKSECIVELLFRPDLALVAAVADSAIGKQQVRA